MRVSKLFLCGQSENISISVKDDKIFHWVFPFSVMCLRPLLSPQTVIGLKIIEVFLVRFFGVIYLSVYHNMCKRPNLEICQQNVNVEKAKLQRHLYRANGNVVEDLLCMTKI